jgi:hypothetical protein
VIVIVVAVVPVRGETTALDRVVLFEAAEIGTTTRTNSSAVAAEAPIHDRHATVVPRPFLTSTTSLPVGR